MLFILGEIFSFMAASCLCYSTFNKEKKKMVFWQIFDSIFNTISNLFLLSYSGFITCIFTTIRNILEYKKFNSKKVTLFLCILLIILGVIFNNKGIIGLFPLVACIEYTIFMFKANTSQTLRVGLIINLFLWIIYDLYIKAYPMLIMDLIIICSSLFNIVKFRKKSKM